MKEIALLKRWNIKNTDKFKKICHEKKIKVTNEITDKTEMLVCLGGDGTFLMGVQMAIRKSVPILGLNFGHLGFLTEDSSFDFGSILNELIEKKYEVEERATIKVIGKHNNKNVFSNIGLNEIVIRSEKAHRMCNLEVFLDGEFISKYVADGIIVSTPTGSTAYSLSAGGPLVEPALPVHILSPICPHALTQRPFVFCNQKIMQVKSSNQEKLILTIDGQINNKIPLNTLIEIRKCSKNIKIVRMLKENFYERLRTKMSWGK